ncbi:EntS/YbdA MFS transporter [Babesia caballi]|uniref:EntS/YbdA MFS transporter n=1 Tax=Babesia caballi TaxID=5871 RepID=A0AAV4LN19_BABCB|nr:EntS/YbdA MFS transporter [Babesia caballi]
MVPAPEVGLAALGLGRWEEAAGLGRGVPPVSRSVTETVERARLPFGGGLSSGSTEALATFIPANGSTALFTLIPAGSSPLSIPLATFPHTAPLPVEPGDAAALHHGPPVDVTAAAQGRQGLTVPAQIPDAGGGVFVADHDAVGVVRLEGQRRHLAGDGAVAVVEGGAGAHVAGGYRPAGESGDDDGAVAARTRHCELLDRGQPHVERVRDLRDAEVPHLQRVPCRCGEPTLTTLSPAERKRRLSAGYHRVALHLAL